MEVPQILDEGADSMSPIRLTKKINNNVAFGVAGNGSHVVVFGKGIGFKRMPHTLTSDDDVSRVFYDVSKGAAGALADIDDKVLLASSDIVELARMELEDVKLNPNLPFTLADHLQFAIQRVREGLFVANPLSEEVAFVYPAELRVARTGVAMVNKRVPVANLPEEESYAVALHLVNGEMGAAGDRSTIDVVQKTAHIMTKVSQIIEESCGCKLDHDSYAYARFVRHFRYLVARLQENVEENTDNGSLFKEAAAGFPKVYLCVTQISAYLRMEYGWTCSNEELLYLMMHVNRLVTT